MKIFHGIAMAVALTVVMAGPVRAESYQLKEITPKVKTALDSRRARYDQLKSLKDQAAVGENNRGYVEALSGDAAAKALVDAENKDRRLIYETIVEQNKLPGDALTTVENVFAQVQQDKAGAGEMIQNFKGEWVKK
jgi:uncharacterized protein YdbL (DUF1318 family)